MLGIFVLVLVVCLAFIVVQVLTHLTALALIVALAVLILLVTSGAHRRPRL